MSRYSRSRTRRKNRGRFGPLLKLLCVIAVGVALTVGATVFFRVETISVSGNRRYTEEDIIAASGIELGDNLYALNKVRIGRNIRTLLPYIGELSITRSLPSTIVIRVVEWEAVAQLAVPDPAQAAAVQEELAGGDQSAEPAVLAQEPWLISVKSKLLEPAPADSRAIPVSGLTPIAPEAGSMLEVPESETTRLSALLALLEALEQAEFFQQVTEIRLENTQLIVRYLDRFDVRMALDADFSYNLRLMQAVREAMEAREGPEIRGSIDLTQKNNDAVFSPEE
ncbi:MAG: FtsQ-type POTRA domain-containing protein [Lawsonibacter sp.]|nr:FtsQ-type POTRA domain-containing protein [Lawsonibacter sp.]